MRVGSVRREVRVVDNPVTWTVVIMAVFAAGVFFARWRRALSDLRKTIAGIPGMRRATRAEGGRLALAALILFAVAYAYMHQ